MDIVFENSSSEQGCQIRVIYPGCAEPKHCMTDLGRILQEGFRNSGGHPGLTKSYGKDRFSPDMNALDINVELWEGPENITMDLLLWKSRYCAFGRDGRNNGAVSFTPALLLI